LRKDAAAALSNEGPRLRKVDAAAALSKEGLIESKDTLATAWLGCWIPNGTKTLEMYMLALLTSGFHGMYSSSSLIMLVLLSLLLREDDDVPPVLRGKILCAWKRVQVKNNFNSCSM
jgi:hypothetical protein